MWKRLVILMAVALGSAIGLTSGGVAADPYDPSPLMGNYTYAEAQAFPDYPVFAVGREFDSLSLTAVERRLTPVNEFHNGRDDSLQFVYGDCEIVVGEDGEGGCSPPVVVQNWRACERRVGDYAADAELVGAIRGVPARWYEEKGRLELHTADAVVVMWAQSESQLLALARSLRLVNAEQFPEYNVDGLPPPDGMDWLLPGLGEQCNRDNVTPDGGEHDVEIP